MIDAIKKIIAPIQRRVVNMIARGTTSKATDEAKGLQRLQITLSAQEVLDGIERMQEYGFASRPLTGAETLAVFLGGDRSHGLVIATDDRRYRPKDLIEGETGLYNSAGNRFRMKPNGNAELTAGKFKFQGTSDELMDLLVQTLDLVKNMNDKLNTTTTNTQLGPMKLNDFATFGTYKTTADTIKGKIAGIKV